MKRVFSLLFLILILTSPLVYAEEEAISNSPTPPAAEQVMPAQPAPPEVIAGEPKVDTGDTAWMLVATALVMLMTLPGLALFYGGLAKRKDSLNTMAMCFVTYCIVSVLWVIYGYTFAFGPDIGGIIGNPKNLFLSGIGIDSLTGTIPEYIFIVFQMTFAAITVALASGAFIERMKFSAWVLFTILWFTLAYLPVAHWVWGGGFLAELGALDFAGGTVVHINAGIGALVGALILGKRREVTLKPSNLTLVITGAGLLWFGWFGFNAGSAVASNGLAGIAFINTNTATAVAALSWMFIEWMHTRKPTLLGLASGAIAGLVAITPAAGFVNIKGAMIMGILAGMVTYFSVAAMKPKIGYDDSLDAFGIHGVSGILGALLVGFFADPAINEASGLFFGNPGQLLTQLIAIVVTIVYVAVVTVLIFFFIKVFIGLRVEDEHEITGLDESQHGEKAYNL
jgi:Amt family ammonium transporter